MYAYRIKWVVIAAADTGASDPTYSVYFAAVYFYASIDVYAPVASSAAYTGSASIPICFACCINNSTVDIYSAALF